LKYQKKRGGAAPFPVIPGELKPLSKPAGGWSSSGPLEVAKSQGWTGQIMALKLSFGPASSSFK